MRCRAPTCDSVAVLWSAPTNAGHPPLHKYKLERQLLATPEETVAAPAWVTANGELDDEDTSWTDSGLRVQLILC